uniref:PX domain-containing protein n=1 Tax=Timema cristinae TaxID=61476 RepID=A0A7R9CEL8_TIMCR|nr:unnamed protein product [Timema cristinae]
MAGRHLCSRRLSEQQLDARRRGLEQYLEKVCAVRVIAESDVMQEFLTDSDDEQRKLQPSEYPHNLYIQNYSTATPTCLCVRKWLFSPACELTLASDEQATTFIFWQAVDEVNRGHIHAEDRLYQLKAQQDSSRKHEYLRLARELTGYGAVVFPHCSCDSRKEGHVVASVGSSGFKLQACREDGVMQPQVVYFSWSIIKEWEVDDDSMAFCFHYQRPEKNPRWVKIFSPYALQFVTASVFGKSPSKLQVSLANLLPTASVFGKSPSDCKYLWQISFRLQGQLVYTFLWAWQQTIVPSGSKESNRKLPH